MALFGKKKGGGGEEAPITQSDDANIAPETMAEEGSLLPQKVGLGSKIKAMLSKKKAGDDDNRDNEVTASAVQTEEDLDEIRTGRLVDLEFDQIQTLKIGKKSIVMGLVWITADPAKKIKEQATSLAKEDENFDLVCQHRMANQLGLAEKTAGIKLGMKAAASCFSEKTMGRNWIAAFRLIEGQEHFWVVSVRNGAVWEDQIISDEFTAKSLFLEELAAPDWQRKIAPDEWSLGGTKEYRLQDVIEISEGLPLKPVYPLKTYAPRIILASLLVGAGVGAYAFYQNYQENQKLIAQQLEQARKASVRVSPSDYPWFDTPELEEFFSLCIPEAPKMIKTIPNWQQSPIGCALDDKKELSIETAWQSTGGTQVWARAAFRPDEPQATFNPEGTAARLRRKIDMDVVTEDLDPAWSEERIDRILGQRFQTTGVDIKVSKSVRKVSSSERGNMPKPVFNYHDLTLTTSAGLFEYARLFSDIPAIVPRTLVYEPNAGTWNLNFRIYHEAILPQ